MSVEQHKAIVRRMIEEPWNQGHLEVLDEICAPTGEATTATGITILRFADGKIVEDRFEGTSPAPQK